mmetsp:Transcript_21229/g.31434  ORF Transcript_21229/g.31434 Transcript_21229/m.31434 type:complete len:84 (-) Transcript_21229:689-940(-)
MQEIRPSWFGLCSAVYVAKVQMHFTRPSLAHGLAFNFGLRCIFSNEELTTEESSVNASLILPSSFKQRAKLHEVDITSGWHTP